MANGIEKIKEYFIDYDRQYTIIGGFACDILMKDAGFDFRHTVDVDMVLTVEALTSDFAKAFWEFIEGGVAIGQDNAALGDLNFIDL